MKTPDAPPFRIIPKLHVPCASRAKGEGPRPRAKEKHLLLYPRRRFPSFTFGGRGQPYLPKSLPDNDEKALQALVLMSTEALIRAQGIKAPIPTKGVLAAYLADPDPDLQAEVDRQFGRSLFHPGCFSDRYLKLYVERLVLFSTAHSSTSNVEPPSPRLAAYLLGGMTLMSMEELCHRVMDVMEIPTPVVEATLSDAMAVVGFGEHANHTHFDAVHAEAFNQRVHEGRETFLKRCAAIKAPDAQKLASTMSIRQDFLVYHLKRGGSFATSLLSGQGAYDGAEQQMIARIKPIVLSEVEALFHGPTKEGMTEFMFDRLNSHTYKHSVALDDDMFSRAVRCVYEKPWNELDFHAQSANLSQDVEVMIARRIISRMSAGRRGSRTVICISAVVLLGLALLTGIPVGKWVAFALAELDRRGETFITPETLDEVIEMLEMSEVGTRAGACVGELREYQAALRGTENEFKSRFAWKLRRGTRPFWSVRTYGPESYYLKGYNHKDEPIYKFSFDPYLSRE